MHVRCHKEEDACMSDVKDAILASHKFSKASALVSFIYKASVEDFCELVAAMRVPANVTSGHLLM
jgi:hypothetical protein